MATGHTITVAKPHGYKEGQTVKFKRTSPTAKQKFVVVKVIDEYRFEVVPHVKGKR